jgi:hypothetical protein
MAHRILRPVQETRRQMQDRHRGGTSPQQRVLQANQRPLQHRAQGSEPEPRRIKGTRHGHLHRAFNHPGERLPHGRNPGPDRRHSPVDQQAGNHTWVEVHDGETWRFTGADEYNKGGFDKAWFTGDAAKAVADHPLHAIWATSWKATGSHFPLVWNPKDKSVPAVNVTARYTPDAKATPARAIVNLRARDETEGDRIVVVADLLDSAGNTLGSVTTKAGTADLNDMPSLEIDPGTIYQLLLKKAMTSAPCPSSFRKPASKRRKSSGAIYPRRTRRSENSGTGFHRRRISVPHPSRRPFFPGARRSRPSHWHGRR